MAVSSLKKLTHPEAGVTARDPNSVLFLLHLHKQSSHCSRAPKACQAIKNKISLELKTIRTQGLFILTN
jgi:hypothetical protein